MNTYYLIVEKYSPQFITTALEPILRVNKEEPSMELIKDGDSAVILVGSQGPTGPRGTGAVATSNIEVHTDNDTLVVDDLGIGMTHGMNSAGNRAFTLPEITVDVVDPVTLLNLGSGRLTVTAGAVDDYVGFSDIGGSIYTDSSNVSITILPVFAIKRWVLTNLIGKWEK